ncbi:uncharacterized protein [Pyrus communis]|uniref:uncharacterized protein n=1 Tax=Pyrus communis TaxID=23211 RepID=UPI0035BFCB97
MRREDEKSDEEDKSWCNASYKAAMAGVMACEKLDRAGRHGVSPHQKVTIALRMLAYASPVDAMDDTYGMSESTCLDNLVEFYHTIVQLYKEGYLRQLNQANLDRLIRKAEDCGFPGMIGSLDCMHWQWKNYPIGWQ